MTLAQGFRPRKLNLSGEAQRRGARAFALASPRQKSRDNIAEVVVPFGPAGRKTADLIAARTAVPWLRDQLDLGKQRILSDRFQKSALGVESVGLSREDRAEIEAESVDPRFAHPVAQAVRHHLDDARMAEVERVAGAGVVDVEARLVRHEPIVGLVVDAFEGKRRTALVALGGMVVDDVQDHFEPAVVEARDHLLEFAQRVRHVGSVARIGRKKADRVIAPIVLEPLLEQMAVVDEGVDRHQFDGRDAKRPDVVDDGLRAEPGVKAPQLLVDLRDAAW